MRRLAERAPELAAEVEARQPGGPRQVVHLQWLEVARVGEVLRAQQVPCGRRERHALKYRQRLTGRGRAYTGRVITPTRDDVIEALRTVEDPELGMDIVELGLFYDVELEGSTAKITHSLTSMGCPAGQMIEDGIRDAAASVPGIEQVEIELVWDPPWTPERMSEDAKFILGFG